MSQDNKGFALKLLDDATVPFSQRLALIEKPLPSLTQGQVLVKMLAAPVNPSDLVYLRGQYGLAPQADCYAGFEGCGIVLKANAGIYGKWLTGKRVAIAAQPGKDGLWAQYAITLASYCLPVRKDIDDIQASTLLVNPLTVICLIERAKQLGAKAVLVNAAASQVGKGIIRYAHSQGVKVLATVRSTANVAVLQKLGADQVLVTQDPDYAQQLKVAVTQLNVTVLLDAVADSDTAITLKQMPEGSTAIIYGRLQESHDPFGGKFAVADMIFRDMHIEGFWLARYIRANPIWKVLWLNRKVQKLFASGILHTEIRGEYGFDDFIPALEHYATHKSDGKVILRPNG